MGWSFLDANRPRSDASFVLPGGESMAAALRRAEQERDQALEDRDFYRSAAETAQLNCERASDEADLARAELASARQELDALRRKETT
jgi:hypothetical protein